MSIASLMRAAGAAAQAGRRRTLAGGAPVNTVPPSIAGTVAHGNILTATPGTWTGSPSLSYQWYAGASPISGATGTTYTCDRADGICGADYIRCVETDSVGATSVDSNDLIYTGADLPLFGWSLDEDVTVVSGGVDSIVSSYGAFSATLTALSSTQRPAYDATGGVGGRPRMLPDGVDDVMTVALTKGSAWATCELGIVGDRVAFSTLSDVWLGYNPAVSWFVINDQDASRWRFTVAGAANVTPTSTYDPDGVLAHYSGDAVTGSINARVGGSVVATSAASVTSRADGNTATLGANATGANAAELHVHAAYMGEALTANQRTDHRALLTRRTGVTS